MNLKLGPIDMESLFATIQRWIGLDYQAHPGIGFKS